MKTSPKHTGKSFLWPLLPLSILGLMIAINLIGLYLAVSDPSFAVEDDYYQKGLKWDQTMAQIKLNRQLGWKIKLDLKLDRGKYHLFAQLLDRRGEPLRPQKLSVEAFFNGRAGEKYRREFTPLKGQKTVYTAQIPAKYFGLWIFRFTAKAKNKTFTQTFRKLIEVE